MAVWLRILRYLIGDFMMSKNFDQWWDETGQKAARDFLDLNSTQVSLSQAEVIKAVSKMAFNAGIKPIDTQGAFVIVVERDNDKGSKINGSGPLVMETYPGRNSVFDTINQARGFNGRYGWTEICRLEPLGSPDECEALMDERNQPKS